MRRVSAHPDNRHSPERGSTLLIYPAAVMVLLLLAAIAIDLSALHLARRELIAATSRAADDGAAMIDRAEARRTGATRTDSAAAERVVRDELAVADLPGRLVGQPTVAVSPGTNTVTVTASLEVEPIFGVVSGRGPQVVTVATSGRLLDVD